jgi:hypothetical protein
MWTICNQRADLRVKGESANNIRKGKEEAATERGIKLVAVKEVKTDELHERK